MRFLFIPLIAFSFAGQLAAQPAQLSKVHVGNRVRLALQSGGACDAKVIATDDTRLTLRLSKDSAECGSRDKIIEVHNSNIQSVARQRRADGVALLRLVGVVVSVVLGVGVALATENVAAGAATLVGGLALTSLAGRNRTQFVISVSEIG